MPFLLEIVIVVPIIIVLLFILKKKNSTVNQVEIFLLKYSGKKNKIKKINGGQYNNGRYHLKQEQQELNNESVSLHLVL